MQTHQIHVANGREAVNEIRRELFVFPEVLEVFEAGGPDVLVVVYAGRPRPGEWLSALRTVGYRTPGRQHVGSASQPTQPEPSSALARSNGAGVRDDQSTPNHRGQGQSIPDARTPDQSPEVSIARRPRR